MSSQRDEAAHAAAAPSAAGLLDASDVARGYGGTTDIEDWRSGRVAGGDAGDDDDFALGEDGEVNIAHFNRLLAAAAAAATSSSSSDDDEDMDDYGAGASGSHDDRMRSYGSPGTDGELSVGASVSIHTGRGLDGGSQHHRHHSGGVAGSPHEHASGALQVDPVLQLFRSAILSIHNTEESAGGADGDGVNGSPGPSAAYLPRVLAASASPPPTAGVAPPNLGRVPLSGLYDAFHGQQQQQQQQPHGPNSGRAGLAATTSSLSADFSVPRRQRQDASPAALLSQTTCAANWTASHPQQQHHSSSGHTPAPAHTAGSGPWQQQQQKQQQQQQQQQHGVQGFAALSSGTNPLSPPPTASVGGGSRRQPSPTPVVGSEASSLANTLSAAAVTYNGEEAPAQQRLDAEGRLAVVDPQRRKLCVPFAHVERTKALNGRLTTPSLCLLYQAGRCRQGANCYQVHANPAVVRRLRAEAESQPCCCRLHGDANAALWTEAESNSTSMTATVASLLQLPDSQHQQQNQQQAVGRDWGSCVAITLPPSSTGASAVSRLHPASRAGSNPHSPHHQHSNSNTLFGPDTSSGVGVSTDGCSSVYRVPLGRTAYTAGLASLLRAQSHSSATAADSREAAVAATIAPTALCRLHGQREGCRFGADCKFVHVCREIVRGELAGLIAAAAPAPSSLSSTVHSLNLGRVSPTQPRPAAASASTTSATPAFLSAMGSPFSGATSQNVTLNGQTAAALLYSPNQPAGAGAPGLGSPQAFATIATTQQQQQQQQLFAMQQQQQLQQQQQQQLQQQQLQQLQQQQLQQQQQQQGGRPPQAPFGGSPHLVGGVPQQQQQPVMLAPPTSGSIPMQAQTLQQQQQQQQQQQYLYNAINSVYGADSGAQEAMQRHGSGSYLFQSGGGVTNTYHDPNAFAGGNPIPGANNNNAHNNAHNNLHHNGVQPTTTTTMTTANTTTAEMSKNGGVVYMQRINADGTVSLVPVGTLGQTLNQGSGGSFPMQ